MNSFFSFFPDADVLLRKAPDEVAPVLLRLALAKEQGGQFQLDSVTQPSTLDAVDGKMYPHFKKADVDRLVGRAWRWLLKEEFIEPVSGRNGQNGWHDLTEKGRSVASGHDIKQFLSARDLPKELLHPAIRERGANALMRSATPGSEGELVSAVRDALITVEDTVRTVAGLSKNDFGVDLMRSAFHPDNGALGDKDTSKPKGEREALSHLFAGVIGRFKNRVAHGSPPLSPVEAQDQLLLASHLLRIIDEQKAANGL